MKFNMKSLKTISENTLNIHNDADHFLGIFPPDVFVGAII